MGTKHLRRKRTALLLVLIMALTALVPAAAFAVESKDFASATLTGQLDSTVTYHNQDTFIVNYVINTGTVKIRNSSALCFAFDNTVLELVDWAGTSVHDNSDGDLWELNSGKPGKGFVNLAGYSFMGLHKDWTEVATLYAESADSSIGYASMQIGRSAIAKAYVNETLASMRLGFREGKGPEDLNRDSLRTITVEETNSLVQSEMWLINSNDVDYQAGKTDGTEDNLQLPQTGAFPGSDREPPKDYDLGKTAPTSDTLSWGDTLKTDGSDYQAGTIIVKNIGKKVLSDVTASVGGGSNFTVEPANRATLEAGESASFSIKPKASLTAGVHTGTITVQAKGGADGTETIALPAVNLEFTVTEWSFAPKESYTATFGAVTSIDLSGAVTGGTAPFTFTVEGGALPEGLTLSAAGKIEGTPVEVTAAAGKSVTVKVTDSGSPAKTDKAEVSIVVNPNKPEIGKLTLTAGNKKIDAKWTANANGAEAIYTLVLTHEEKAQSAAVTIYEYKDGADAVQTIRVTAGATDPTFTSEGARWITAGGATYKITSTSSITAEITPAGIVQDDTKTTTASSVSFEGLTNEVLYTVTLTAGNSAGSSQPVSETATPKAGSSGGGGGGGGGGSSSGTATTGTDIKKDIPSSGSVSVSAGELKNAKSVEVKNNQITVTLNQQAVNALDKNTGLVIKTEKKSGATVNDKARELLESRPVFDVTATQNGKAVTDFGSGKITISIAYNPASGEDTGKLFLYSINDDGEAEKVSGSRYDATLKAVTGQTSHLSLYAIGYDKAAADMAKPSPTALFRDISSGDWFYTAVMELAGREIVSGIPDEDANGNSVGTYSFHPQANVTRAEFVTMLAKAAGADLRSYSAKVFNDVNTNDWYAGAVAWANSTGVASGTGDGNFSPTANITRQDMAVMVSKYITNVAETTLTAKNEKITFTDTAQIAEYAKTAVEGMQTAGVLSGIPNEDAKGNPIGTYQYRPFANATRAEAAAMLNGLLGAL